jgi:hypothetical protein
MAELTKDYINNFIKPNFYLLQNVLTFLLPSRKKQLGFLNNRINVAKKKLSVGSTVDHVHHLVEWESLHIERMFLTYLLSEEMGTYFEAMTNHYKGDIIRTVLSTESYNYANEFYQLAKQRKRDFFSRLMMYPYIPELRAAFNMPEDPELVALINKVINVSCNYLWYEKNKIQCFREKYKGVYNSYKHGMSILYNMRSDLKVNLKDGSELSGFSNAPLVLKIRINRKRSITQEQWIQLFDFQTIEEDTIKTFSGIYSLFHEIVRKRIAFLLDLIESHQYDSSSQSYVPYKNVKISMRVFNLSEISSDDIKILQEKYGLILDQTKQ